MLVLSRRLGEGIHIGDDVTVHILRVGDGGEVRIGVDAPPELRILRDELIDRDEPPADPATHGRD